MAIVIVVVVDIIIVSARVRSTTGSYVFTGVCLSKEGRISLWSLAHWSLILSGGTHGLWSLVFSWEGYPIQGTPGQDRGGQRVPLARTGISTMVDRLCQRRYASCSHAGGLSCCLWVTRLPVDYMLLSKKMHQKFYQSMLDLK